MKLLELKERLEQQIMRDRRDFKVVIKTSNKSIGSSSSVDIEDVYARFDWDNGTLFIKPEKDLVLKDLNRDVALEIINFNKELSHLAEGMTKITYLCRNCESKVSKNDNYCRNCGQKLKIG